MLQLLFRQRRRLILFALLTCVPVSVIVLWVGFVSQDLTGWKMWLFLHFVGAVMAIMSLCVMVLPILLLRFLPRWSGLIDSIPIIIVVLIPMSMLEPQLSDIPFVGQNLVFVELVMLFLVVRLRVFDLLLPKITYKASRSYVSNRSAEAIWAAHFPDPRFLNQHWTHQLRAIALDEHDPNIRIVTYAQRKGELVQHQTILVKDAPHHFTYRFEQKQSSITTGSLDVTIADQGFTRLVTHIETLNKLPLPSWLLMWFGDMLGDEMDHHLAVENGWKDLTITGAILRNIPTRQTGVTSPWARVA